MEFPGVDTFDDVLSEAGSMLEFNGAPKGTTSPPPPKDPGDGGHVSLWGS